MIFPDRSGGDFTPNEFTQYLRDLADYCISIEQQELEEAFLESAHIIDSDTDHLFTLQFQHIINSEMIRELSLERNQWKKRAMRAEKKLRKSSND
jgi:hypothetical protein